MMELEMSKNTTYRVILKFALHHLYYLCKMYQVFFRLVLVCIAATAAGQNLTQASFSKSNTGWDEQAPVISPDGKTLFYTIANHPQNIGGKRDLGDIWMSIRIGDEWTAPVHAGTVLNDAAYNSVIGISADGEQLFLSGHYSPTGKAATQGISVSRKTAAGWSVPENIAIPYFLNKAPFLQGHLSKDGTVFVFAAESRETQGAEDIYASFRSGSGKWSEPRNLGRTINTSLQEWTPSLSDDHTLLYFSSNGRKGYGSFDVYFSQRLDDTWTNWSVPVNMGASVNNEGRNLFYQPYPASGFVLFTSSNSSDEYSDIKIYYPPREIMDSLAQKLVSTKTDTIVKLTEIIREKPIGKEEKVVRVSGKVMNAKNNQPIAAEIHYQSDVVLKAVAGPEGRYEIKLPSVHEYVIKVESPGYVGTMERLDIRTFEMKELEMNYTLQPIEVGTTVNLKNVLFQQSTANLLTESSDELNMVADLMKSNPNIVIELSGHTDNRGLHAHNVRLSKERVDKVKEYLVAKGIDAARISGKGYGGIRPIAENDAEETRKLNRRVEFTIVKN